MPSVRAVSTNHSKSSGGSTGSATTVTVKPCAREPRAGEVPVAEVRQREHRALARRPRRPTTCSTPVQWKCVVDPLGRERRESEQLVEVAPVRVERGGDGPAQRGAAEVGPVDPPQVALHLARDARSSPRRELRDPRAAGVADDRRAPGARPGRRRGTRSTTSAAGRIDNAGRGAVSDDARRSRDPAGRSVCGRCAAHHCARLPARGSSVPEPRWWRVRRRTFGRRLAPHLHEALHRGERGEHQHDPEHRHEDVEGEARRRGARAARPAPSGHREPGTRAIRLGPARR